MKMETKGLDSLQKALKGLSKVEFKSVAKEIADLCISNFQKHILDEKTPDGKAWEKWAKGSIGGRRMNGSIISPSSKLLIDTGLMFNSFKFNIKTKSLIFSNNTSYAVYQNAAREFMGLDSTIEKKIDDVLWKAIESEWEKS